MKNLLKYAALVVSLIGGVQPMTAYAWHQGTDVGGTLTLRHAARLPKQSMERNQRISMFKPYDLPGAAAPKHAQSTLRQVRVEKLKTCNPFAHVAYDRALNACGPEATK